MAKRKNNKKKFIIFGVLGVLLIIVIILALMSGNSEKIINVETESVSKRTLTQVVAATGTINPIEQVVITPEVNGEIVELPVEEGDKINKGDLLIRIKPDIYVAQRNRAKATLEAAKAQLKVRQATLDQMESEYKRIQGLYEKELASDSQLEMAKANYLQNEGMFEAQKSSVIQAQEALKEAEENLARTTIYSPLTGTVSQLNVELGERVLGSNFTQGTNIMTVADLSKMEAIVEVDENDVVLVSQGDTAMVEVDAFQDKKFRGTVYQIGNSAQSNSIGTQNEVVNFEVKIKMLEVDPGIRPGMSCDADIATETRNSVLTVPIQSVTARVLPQKPVNRDSTGTDSVKTADTSKFGDINDPVEVVFLVKDNRAILAPVKTGISDDTHMQILEGISADDVIVSGPYRAISKELEDSVLVTYKGQAPGKKNEE